MKAKNPNAKQSARMWLNYSGAGGYLNSDKFVAQVKDAAEIISHRKNLRTRSTIAGLIRVQFILVASPVACILLGCANAIIRNLSQL